MSSDFALHAALMEQLEATRKRKRVVKSNRDIKMAYSPEKFYLNRTDYADDSGKEADDSLGLDDLIVEGIEWALLTSYMVELPYLLSKCPLLRSVPVFIHHGDGDVGTKSPLDNVFLSMPNLPIPYGVCHGKILLLKYENFIRVAVTTANLCFADWELKVQGTWFQDIPLKSEEHNQETLKKRKTDAGSIISIDRSLGDDFQDTLQDYLEKIGFFHEGAANAKFPKDFSLSDYNFSSVRVVLVSSVPGYHKRPDIPKYGHMKLRRWLSKAAKCSIEGKKALTLQCSSFGRVDEKWFKTELMESMTSNAKVKQLGKKKDTHKVSKFEIIWPTVDFVRGCFEGTDAGGSLCLYQSNLTELMLSHMYKWNPPQKERKRLCPHIKTYAVRGKSGLDWCMLTSANVSKAAWGSLQKKGEQVMIRHYEMGVVFVPELLGRSLVNENDTSEYANNIAYPLPYASESLVKYEKGDVPWTMEELRS